ncbi:MAG: hypothetical protein QXU98_11215 [Candidatus Parvarchaeota archaeon]
MMIRKQGSVPKVILHKQITTHPLITSPTKGSIQPGNVIYKMPYSTWLKKEIGSHPIGPTGPIGGPKWILPINPINDYRKPPILPINPIIPYHPITISPFHPITITPIQPTQIVQQKVQKTTPPPQRQPDDSGAIGAGLGALMSIFLSLI